MSIKVLIMGCAQIRTSASTSFRPVDITFHLDSQLVSLIQPNPQVMRTVTIGPDIYTQYKNIEDIPVSTVAHELVHLYQWMTMRVPRTPNFLLNYLVLRRSKWERDAATGAALVLEHEHRYIHFSFTSRHLFKGG